MDPQANSGAGFVNSCIHSGNTEHSGGDTVWYNYVITSAGTITNKDTSDATGNLNTATESICPKNWTLPSVKQIDNNKNIAEFSPVLGGTYYNGSLDNEDTRGLWWGSTAYNNEERYILRYDNSSLSTRNGSRRNGRYIRCVSEEKTVTDLTYMQKTTPNLDLWKTILGCGKLPFHLCFYDLATHGTSDCYGTYDDNTGTGGGAGYVNSCIHSGIIAAKNTYTDVDTPTVWYNYTVASAGTITNKDASDTTGNLNTATESICPKGWTLPTTKQMDNNRNTAEFSPVLGGNYYNGTLYNEDTNGRWWGSTAYNGARRYRLDYNGSSLYTGRNYRHYGLYIRCVSEEKTVTDLTYMQKHDPRTLTVLYIVTSV